MNTNRPVRRLALAPVLLVLAGCAGENQPGVGEVLGTVGGAVAGGVLGNKVGDGSGQKIAIAAGAILGGLAGNWIGKNVDENVRRKAAAAQTQALDTGESITWAEGSDTGTVEIGRTGTNNRDETCREFTHTVQIGGREQQAYGTACRDAAGDWKIVQEGA